MSHVVTQTPVLVVKGIAEDAVSATMLALQFGVPAAVAVRHSIDVEHSTLTRVVSDLSGVIEHEVIDLEHACVPCAIREDVLPTLQRLAASGRWQTIVAGLPLAAEAPQICRQLTQAPRTAPGVRVAAIVAALDGATLVDDLLGDELLRDRGLLAPADGGRGVAETACAMVEYADLISLTQPPTPTERALLEGLARPMVSITARLSEVAGPDLLNLHQHRASEAWIAPVRREALPTLTTPGAWRLDLMADRPFHPDRLLAEVANLGGGPHRSRGCFWLPTRPDYALEWAGAGGLLSVGTSHRWGRSTALTRLVWHGVDRDAVEVAEAFRRALLTEDEIARRGVVWEAAADGLEEWLGPIRRAA